ncbi:hypothetical protein [Dactylosporangium salmoneum]|uniref:Uncharacterized protein n=1 Tax=Dactylosporangium salmoneum TaxID=53361 RepID=A0ABN3FL54_9ACTN
MGVPSTIAGSQCIDTRKVCAPVGAALQHALDDVPALAETPSALVGIGAWEDLDVDSGSLEPAFRAAGIATT